MGYRKSSQKCPVLSNFVPDENTLRRKIIVIEIMDYIKEPEENKLIRYGPEVVEDIRKEYNLEKKERREEAITILADWVKTQDHIVKKDFSEVYLEKCLITSKGSLERAKIRIDKMCTLRTLMPKYFQTFNLQQSDIMPLLDKGYFGVIPRLTKEYYRVIIIKIKPNAVVTMAHYTMLNKFFIITAEYLTYNDYCKGYILVGDCYDANAAEVLSKVNLPELQQFIPLMTEGYGCKIKGIIFITASKFIEGFVKMLKPFFSEKIASRIHVATSQKGLQEFIPEDILPEEYGGIEESVEVLHEKLIESVSTKAHQDHLREMSKACTDESRRRRDKFNEQYMGMPGTFRTLSLD